MIVNPRVKCREIFHITLYLFMAGPCLILPLTGFIT